jgi:hypothetical protein
MSCVTALAARVASQPGRASPGRFRGRAPSRVQVNRQITMMEAGASMPLSRPNPSRATDPAVTAAPTAIPASAPSQPRVSHDSIRAVRASRSHSAVVGRVKRGRITKPCRSSLMAALAWEVAT